MQLSILHIRLWVRMMRLHVHEEYCVASDACVRSYRLRTPLERLRPTLADWLHSRNALYRRPILPAAGVQDAFRLMVRCVGHTERHRQSS